MEANGKPFCETPLEAVEGFVQSEFGERNALEAVRYLTPDVSIFGMSSFRTAPDRGEARKLLSDEAAGLPEGKGARLFYTREKAFSHDCAVVTGVVSINQDWSCDGWQCRLFPPVYADYLSPGFCEICGYTQDEFFELFKGRYVELRYWKTFLPGSDSCLPRSARRKLRSA